MSLRKFAILAIAFSIVSSAGSAQAQSVFGESHRLDAFQLEIMQREANLRILEKELNTLYWTKATSNAVVIAITTLSLIGFRRPLVKGLAAAGQKFMASSRIKKTLVVGGAGFSVASLYLDYEDIVEMKQRIAVARLKLQYARATVNALVNKDVSPSTDKCELDEILRPNAES